MLSICLLICEGYSVYRLLLKGEMLVWPDHVYEQLIGVSSLIVPLEVNLNFLKGVFIHISFSVSLNQLYVKITYCQFII